ncbi:MAG: putative transcriptional regulator [uncultured archaeon A07HB70]|jgi:Predicted transcriptional regulator|nr:MAG: putative transcriptional regulator [uncultured archaeon A07HB70]
MGNSMIEHLRQDMECEGLLECFYGLKPLDREVFGVLVDAVDPLTVDEVAEAVDRERSTAYRSVRRLHDAGFVEQDQVNYDSGSYYHVYSPTPAEEVADDLQRTLNDWYAEMGQLIAEFERKYEDAATTSPAEP